MIEKSTEKHLQHLLRLFPDQINVREIILKVLLWLLNLIYIN